MTAVNIDVLLSFRQVEQALSIFVKEAGNYVLLLSSLFQVAFY